MKRILPIVMFVGLLFMGCESVGDSSKKDAAVQKEVVVLEDTVFVGDRILDVANSLGYTPKYAAARFGQWPKSFGFKTQRLGCPNRVIRKAKGTIPNLIESEGVKRLVVEKTKDYCMFVKGLEPIQITEIVKGMNVEIVVIDFTKGERAGIIEMAKFLGKESEGVALANKYEKELKNAKSLLNSAGKGKRVAVLNGYVKKDTGRLFVYAEASGFYTDKFFIKPLGAKNVTDLLNKDKNEIAKGSFPVMNLEVLVEANPDVIVMFGNEETKAKMKEEFKKIAAKNPKFAAIPAIKNGALAENLKYYVESDIEDAPAIFTAWANYFKNLK